MKGAVRVRFAPSPTGYLHVGGARTLFFNWLFAKRHGGDLVLRIEDTDQARSTREAEKMILSDIAALQLQYTEGPDVGGPYPPYRQSERLELYAKLTRELLEAGKAYFCFCSDELLTQKREAALKQGRDPHYDGTCASLSKEEARAKIDRGERAGVRFRAPQKTYAIDDEVRGRVEFKEGMVGDFFITRTPANKDQEIATGIGMPVYNFCCVIDDNAMNISHVIRAEEHLSNTARQLMIYEAFGWKPPVYAHTALVLGTDRQKLSKRSGDVSVHEYLAKGYLPEALLNFLALLGWWPGNELKPKSGHPEILSVEELVSSFDLKGLQKAPAVFDVQKLQWMNGYYIRMLPLAEIAKRARPFFEAENSPLLKHPPEWFESAIDAVREKVALLSELPRATEVFLGAVPELEAEARTALAEPSAKAVVDTLVKELSARRGSLTPAEIDEIQKKVAGETGVKGKGLFMPIRAVTTGKAHGPDLKKILPLLEREALVGRINELRKQAGV